MFDFMHKHKEAAAWKNEKFEKVFDLFEEDEPSSALMDRNDMGLDRSEFVKLVKRMAQL